MLNLDVVPVKRKTIGEEERNTDQTHSQKDQKFT